MVYGCGKEGSTTLYVSSQRGEVPIAFPKGLFDESYPALPLSFIQHRLSSIKCFPSGSDGKESACNAGDLGLIPGLGRSAGEGNGYPLQYSFLENSTDRGAWWAAVHAVAELDTTEQLTLSLTTCQVLSQG